MARSVVGVDIGSASVRGIEVHGFDSPRPAVARFGEVALPETAVRRGEVIEVGTVATALRRLWSTAGFKSKDVVLGIGGSRVFARDLNVPLAPIAQIRESLPFHVQELLPVPVSDVLLDFYPIGTMESPTGPVANGLLVAGIKEAIDANVKAAMTASLRPVHVDLIPFALSRAIAPVDSARGCEVIIGIGADTTNVVVVTDGVPQFVRIIPGGGDDITRALVKRLEWAPEQAERAKRAVGLSVATAHVQDRPVIEIVYEVVGELLTNLRNTLSYYASARPDQPVQRMVFTGGGAMLNGLANALAEMTRLPVSFAEPFSRMTMPRQRHQQQHSRGTLDPFTTALGLSLGSHA